MGQESGNVEQQFHPLAVVRDLLRRKPVEFDHCLAQACAQRLILGQRGQEGAHTVQQGFKVAPRQIVLGRKVAEEGPAADPACRSNLIHRDCFESALIEQHQRNMAQLVLCGHRFSSGPDRRGLLC